MWNKNVSKIMAMKKEYIGKITNYDSSKAKGVLGWNPMAIEDSVRDTINWIKHKLS